MDIQRAKQLLWDKDETQGYVEREAAIDAFLAGGGGSLPQAERYVSALEAVLDALSTPIEPGELVLGRMVEGPLPYELEPVPAGGKSHIHNPFQVNGRNTGHMSLDYAPLLQKGLRGLAEELARNAGTPAQRQYARLMAQAVEAIGRYSQRYARAAEEAGLPRAAAALRRVPLEPAYDLFSALQSVWLVEMILSCVIGGRDFAYSRLDLALLPFFCGTDPAYAQELLVSFLLKNNEIGGMGSELHEHMPVPCAATNIYLMLGGRGAQEALELDLCFLRAAEAVKLPQPVLALRMCKDDDPRWPLACAHAAQALNGQAALYNDEALLPALRSLGLTQEQALHYTMSGCNRAEYAGHQSSDAFHNCPAWLLEAFYDPRVQDMDGLLAAFDSVARRELARHAGNPRVPQAQELRVNLESLLLTGCVEKATDIENGGLAVETFVHNLCGIATVADSLSAIQTLVFEEKRLDLPAFRQAVRENFQGRQALLAYLKNRCPKFGNDDDRADRWARAAGEILARAVRDQGDGRIHIPSFYSLYFHQQQGHALGATPDGRLAGEAISENQSPVYGCDREGPTALLLSVSKLPLCLCGAGGLNLRLAKAVDDALLAALVQTFFELGGINLAPSVLSRQTLLEARAHPEQYRNLCVRIVGYSEVYLRLPEELQLELLQRTELAV